MQIKTDIQNDLTDNEREVLHVIREVVRKYTPSTKAYIVGGWVRDKLLGIPSDDIDIMIDNMTGEDFARLITKYLDIKNPKVIEEKPEQSKYITTAIAHIPLSDGSIQKIDFAQARKEIYHEDSRIPSLKPATPQEDAYRRDLTINSLFFNVINGKIEDFTGMGIKDMLTDTIRTPENPLKTFSDDPLRIFRVIRFAAKYNGKIDPETYNAMMDPSLRDEIKKKVSKDRIGAEITKMLKNANPEIAIELLKNTGLWQDILNEALMGTKYEGKMAPLDMEQNNPHHTLSLWGHTMQSLKNLLESYTEAEDEKRITMILSSLMHDLGKLFEDIQAESKSHPGTTSYHGHEKESQEITEHILRYLKMEKYIQQVSGLARYHMRPHRFTEEGVGGIRSMRRFIRQMGEASLNWLDVFNLSVADAYSKGVDIDPVTIQKYQVLEQQLQEALLSMGNIQEKNKIEPVLNGHEIMQILNIKPGPWMSEITEYIKELKDEDPEITKDEASLKIQERFKDVDFSQYKKASKDDGDPASTCPMHLFREKNKEITSLLNDKKYYEAFTLLRQIKEEYRDEKVLRLIAYNILKLLLIDEKYRDEELLNYIFNKAMDGFFDPVLCSSVLGILLLINTATEDEVIEEIGTRMSHMSPGTLQTILDMLPEKIDRPKIRKLLKLKLNEH